MLDWLKWNNPSQTESHQLNTLCYMAVFTNNDEWIKRNLIGDLEITSQTKPLHYYYTTHISLYSERQGSYKLQIQFSALHPIYVCVFRVTEELIWTIWIAWVEHFKLLNILWDLPADYTQNLSSSDQEVKFTDGFRWSSFNESHLLYPAYGIDVISMNEITMFSNPQCKIMSGLRAQKD